MRRIEAARQAERGLQILTLPQLAARLAGGFSRPARAPDLDRAIRKALDLGGLRRMEPIKDLPGCARAVARTLNRIWRADFILAQGRAPHIDDVRVLEERVRQYLPAGVLTPRDLRGAALAHIQHASAVLGPVTLERCTEIAPLWRPLIEALRQETDVVWCLDEGITPDWYGGTVKRLSRADSAVPEVVACADPRAEIVEALRWMRGLIASGAAKPEEIAICSATTETWDMHMLALGRDAQLPLHFSHGLPSLASRDGQVCAALAELLLNGISQERVRRFMAYQRGAGKDLVAVPANWHIGIEADAALFEYGQWERALEKAARSRSDGVDARPTLLPVLRLLNDGIDAADRAGALLGPSALALWREALRRGPAKALPFSLEELRIPDERDPGSAVVWCPADHLCGAPRPFVWLLGLTTRSWPRSDSEDPLLPSHILPPAELGIASARSRDESAFRHIIQGATKACVLSRALRDPRGAPLSASPLLARDAAFRVLKRTRVPTHAFSESDRLLARPGEAASLPFALSASAAWNDWNKAIATPHDGMVRASHPAILQALDRVQSATSLRRLLRDPLGFVWRYALGWNSPALEQQPLERDNRSFGELVHALLKRTVDELEPTPGLGRASEAEIDAALDAAIAEVRQEWPLERPVPPLMLWDHTLAAARLLALKALTLDEPFQDQGSRSWTELPFGQEKEENAPGVAWPWSTTAEVRIPGTNVRIRGNIDRLDLKTNGSVRLSDYKTGREPKKAEEIVLDRGRELQRITYALATAQLLPDSRRIQARLIFLAEEGPKPHVLRDIDGALRALSLHVNAAIALLTSGVAVPGLDAREEWNDLRLALPVAREAYFQRKTRAFADALKPVDDIWGTK